MKNVRLFIRLFAVVIAIVLVPLSVASSAFAYPPGVSATIQVSTTAPHICETIQVGGTGFNPNEQVTVTERGVIMADAQTDASGVFTVSFKVIGPVGSQVVKAADTSGGEDSVTIKVSAAGSACSGGGSSSGGAPTSASVHPTSASRSPSAGTSRSRSGRTSAGVEATQSTAGGGGGAGGTSGSGGLAFTGIQILALLLLALLLLAAGIAITRAGRARHRA